MYTFNQYQLDATRNRQRAERVSRMLIERARESCKQAGLDSGLLGIHPHNALCSYKAGRPWKDVNYSLVRKTLWLIERSYEPGRLCDVINQRLFERTLKGNES